MSTARDAIPAVIRFGRKVLFMPNGCWEWQGYRDKDGYGTFYPFTGHPMRAHRWAYEHWVGPIPEGLGLMHSCDNPPCVFPGHLSPGTQKANIADSTEKGRRSLTGIGAVNAAKTECVNGHSFAEHGYVESRGGRQCKVCLSDRQAAYYLRKKAKTSV